MVLAGSSKGGNKSPALNPEHPVRPQGPKIGEVEICSGIQGGGPRPGYLNKFRLRCLRAERLGNYLPFAS
jgi:hypothetical protein